MILSRACASYAQDPMHKPLERIIRSHSVWIIRSHSYDYFIMMLYAMFYSVREGLNYLSHIAVTESPTDCDCHAIQLHYMGQYQADQADQANQANQLVIHDSHSQEQTFILTS